MNTARKMLRRQALRVAADDVVAVPSPCMSVCRMDMNTELCEGCLRTLDEVAAWGRMGEDEKREVWALIAKRLAAEEGNTP